MKHDLLKNALLGKGGGFVEINVHKIRETIGLSDLFPAVEDYCQNMITATGYSASQIGVLGADSIMDENAPGVAPGGRLNEYGYLVVAISVGGNALAVDGGTGSVYWAMHNAYSSKSDVCYKNDNGEYVYEPISPDSMKRSMKLLSKDFYYFFYMLVSDELVAQLDALD